MSAQATREWKERNREHVRKHNLKYMRKVRQTRPDLGIIGAYAERFRVTKRKIINVGTAQLCHCKSDEARRLLLKGDKR